MAQRLRRLGAELPFIFVVAVLVAAVVYLLVAPGHWRRATILMAAGLIGAGVLRLVLSQRQAGLLAVRSRWWDVVCYLAVGAVILAVDIRLH